MDPGGFEGHIRADLGIVQPEGHIDTLDLLNVIFRLEGLGKQGFPLVMVRQGSHGGSFVHLEGNDHIRLLAAGELPGDNGGIAAIGAGSGGSGLVADQLRAAGGAVVGVEVFSLLTPVLSGGIHIPPGLVDVFLRLVFRRLPGGILRMGVLLGEHVLDVLHREAAAAVIALQHPGFTAEMQRAGTGGALVIGDFTGHFWRLLS